MINTRGMRAAGPAAAVGRAGRGAGAKGKPINLHLKMDCATVDGFSGHSDRRQLVNYISTLEPRPERIIICHGEDHKCSDLASTLYKKFGIETRAPMNLETIRLK